jgi:transcriptional regulator with XRE-family HTH domain
MLKFTGAMKKYNSLGELLVDFRKENDLSQTDFAAQMNVDVRTVQRWEKDETLVKPEKEKALANDTLLPYQLIRNLNAISPIATYYDFRVRKYSLTRLNNDLPDADWLKERIEEFSQQIRPIEPDNDIVVLRRDLKTQKLGESPLNLNLLKRAQELLPELNLIIMDRFDNYSGHSIFFPISALCHRKLLRREIRADQIQVEDLVNYKNRERPVFLNFSITADCNDNIYFLAHQILKFFVDLPTEDYVFCSYTSRYDSFELNKQIGLELVWEDSVEKDALGLEYHPRFYEGNLNAYLRDEKTEVYEEYSKYFNQGFGQL